MLLKPCRFDRRGRTAAPASDDAYTRDIIEQVVANPAERGSCVIVGPAGQAVLQNTHAVFKVLVSGSRERRMRRVMEEQGLVEKDAQSLIKDSDHQRVDFFKHVYDIDWLEGRNVSEPASARDEPSPVGSGNK